MRTFLPRQILVALVPCLCLCLWMMVAAGCATSKASSGATGATRNVALDFYPLLLNWGWAYDVESEGRKVLALYSVVERRGNVAVVRNGDDRIEYLIQPDGIARREGSLPGDYLVRLPMVVGTAWPVAGGQATVVEAGQKVSTTADTYRECAVVEEVRGQPSRVTRTTYCKGAGPVKIEMRVYSPMKMDFETIVRATLLSVTRPEDEADSK
jgi:hypothetical protein